MLCRKGLPRSLEVHHLLGRYAGDDWSRKHSRSRFVKDELLFIIHEYWVAGLILPFSDGGELWTADVYFLMTVSRY